MRPKRYSGVIVKHRDKVLLCKRNSYSSFPNMWSIPAGKIEPNESTKEAAYREFFEETNINLDYDFLQFTGVIPVEKKTTDDIKSMMYVYLYDSESEIIPDFDNAIDGHEHVQWIYVSYNELIFYNIGVRLSNLLKKILT